MAVTAAADVDRCGTSDTLLFHLGQTQPVRDTASAGTAGCGAIADLFSHVGQTSAG